MFGKGPSLSRKEQAHTEDDEEKNDDKGSDHDDDKGDDDDNSDQGGTGLIVYEKKVTKSDASEQNDYMNDAENEEEAEGEGEHDDVLYDEDTSEIFINVQPITSVPASQNMIIYLCHDVKEGEFVYNYTKEEIAKMCGIDDERFEFNFEEELMNIDITKPDDYVSNHVQQADDYDEVIIEDDPDNELPKYSGEDTDDFPMFTEKYAHEADDLVKSKIEERIKDGESPRLSKDQIREARKLRSS
ncbi:protein PFC0760c-like [Helianthus annuus]|uniref:protein PFC0760c-like n=1 Tax=Helianthus annuus TaxID=4232 RepID=UPI001653290D|nr:protein PFC0760c-like [Helianthus annuus]